ncbi:hypothetical protein BDY19DRAFT_773752 [Irpex rosettiformis]|uniref:Uncharacterized protein n=1 Tax=Irpex rosettiformis TaxID=378272 RepID=A0ACB8U7V1_9APHY|nr:hypothetical protein BDY19DRAFT_773752 [Irpex rosettiformis]
MKNKLSGMCTLITYHYLRPTVLAKPPKLTPISHLRSHSFDSSNRIYTTTWTSRRKTNQLTRPSTHDTFLHDLHTSEYTRNCGMRVYVRTVSCQGEVSNFDIPDTRNSIATASNSTQTRHGGAQLHMNPNLPRGFSFSLKRFRNTTTGHLRSIGWE